MNVCLVEDNPELCKILVEFLNGQADIEVVSSHDSAESALTHAEWSCVDILLVDIDLPAMSGTDLIRKVHPMCPNISILVYTIHEDSPSVLEAIRAGACGYLIKGSDPSELLASLYEVYAGGSPMSPKIARYVLAQLQVDIDNTINDAEKLTMREVVILRLLDSGASNKVISDNLGVSPHTIHTHIKNVYRKLHAHSRMEAIRTGRRRGLL